MKIQQLLIVGIVTLTLSACSNSTNLGDTLLSRTPELPSAPDRIPDKKSAQLTFAWCKDDIQFASKKLHTNKDGNLFGAGVAHGTIQVKKVTIWEDVQGVFLILNKVGTDPMIYDAYSVSAKHFTTNNGTPVDFTPNAHVMILGTLENNNLKSTAELSNFTEDQILVAIQNQSAITLHMNFFFRAYEFGLPSYFTQACKIEVAEKIAVEDSLAKAAMDLPSPPAKAVPLPPAMQLPNPNNTSYFKYKMPWCGDSLAYLPRPFKMTSSNRPDGITQAQGIPTVLEQGYDEVSPVTIHVNALNTQFAIGGVQNGAFKSSAAISPADEKKIMTAIKTTSPITLDLYFVDQEPIAVGVPSYFTKACRIEVKH